MIPLLKVLAFIPMVIGARLRRIERRTIARAMDAGATVSERAILLEQAGKLGDFVRGRLERAGVLIPVGNDRYYFDAAAYAAFRARRRQRALLVSSLLAIAITILYLRGDIS